MSTVNLTIDTLDNGTIPQIKEWCKNNSFTYPYKLKKADAINFIKTEYNKRIGYNNNTAVSTLNIINKAQPETVITIDNLSNNTVDNIKNWAKENNYNIPTGLKKEHMIDYIKGVHYERSNSIIYEAVNSTMKLNDLVPVYTDNNINWLEHLNKHGWVTVPINGWKVEFTDMFFNWFESCCTDFKKSMPDTWLVKNMPTLLHGILKHYFGHTELQWQIRELCAPIFARIWNCKEADLLCSFDGGCFLPAKEKKNQYKSWIHIDQSRYQRSFQAVQGVVNFVDNGPEDGGLVLVENSKDVFEEYMDKYPSEGIVWGPSNMGDPMLATKRLIKICAPAGHILLFDSRVFHCNVAPSGSTLKQDNLPRFRMAIYVSMQLRINATVKELKKRVELYQKGRLTGHWCYGHYFSANAEHPYTHGATNNRPQVIEIAKLNDLRKRLIGYE